MGEVLAHEQVVGILHVEPCGQEHVENTLGCYHDAIACWLDQLLDEVVRLPELSLPKS